MEKGKNFKPTAVVASAVVGHSEPPYFIVTTKLHTLYELRKKPLFSIESLKPYFDVTY